MPQRYTNISSQGLFRSVKAGFKYFGKKMASKTHQLF